MKFYTVPELAKLLKVDPETIRRYLQRGILQGYKVGKDWRIEEAAVKEYLEKVSNRKED